MHALLVVRAARHCFDLIAAEKYVVSRICTMDLSYNSYQDMHQGLTGVKQKVG